MKRRLSLFLTVTIIVAAVLSVGVYVAQAANILWSSAGGSAWLTGTNWTGNAVPTGTDVAQFGANPTGAGGVGINMNGATNNGANNQAAGAIEITSARTTSHLVGNSSTTAGGTLTINGATVNSVANVIVRNASSQLFTVQNTQGSGNQTMSVALGNATDNIVNIDGTGGITISSVISGASRKLTKAGAGTGTLTLSGVNTYSGDTTISSGTLALSGSGSIVNSPNIIIAGGATFDVTNLTTALTLASGQGLKGSGTGTTGTINTSAAKGLTTAANSPLQFTAYNGSTAPLTIGGAGTVTLQSGNVVTVTVSNGGTPLGAGTYTLIAKGASGTVAGTAPTSLTVNGDGLASGTAASLSITGAQLVMNVVSTTGKYRSRQSGNWNDFNTWQTDTGGGFVNAVAGQTPTSAADTIQIQNTHTVTVTANVDADQLTVDSGATLSVNNGVTFTVADGTSTDLTDNGTVATAGNITNNGQAVINNTLQIDQGGFPGGGTGTYSYDQTNATLVFNNTSGSFGVNNFNFWPTSNGPQNVNVKGAGGISLNVARTVGLLFQYAAGVSNAGNLTLNGTSQVNAGGFTSGSPTYGASSLLKYNVNAGYGRNGEWLPNATSGAGYPANVQLSNNTNLDLPNGSSGVFFQMSGNLTIDSGSTMNLNGSPAMTQPLRVLGNIGIAGTLTLSNAPGGDIQVGGNWTRTGTFNANGRAVTFNGAGTQTIALGSAGTEAFAYLIVDKPSGNLTLSSSPATSVNVTSPSGGSALQIVNEGGIDLNGNGMTLNGAVAGTNILVGGASASATRNVTGTGAFNITNGAKSVTNNNGKTLTFGTGVNVALSQGMDFGVGMTTVNGTLTLASGGFVNINAPTYGSSSTLLYDCTCVYGRGFEWTSATSGPGAPNNVTANTNTDVDLGSTTPGTALQAAGNLTANSGGRVLMTLDDNSHAMTAALTVLKDVTVNAGGTLRLSIASGGDLKVQGNFTNNGTFTPNSRAVFFEGTATQNVTDASGTATMPYVRVNKGGGTVALQSNLTALATSGGDSIQFLGTTSTITLNGETLTLGSTIGTPPAGSGLVGDTAATLSLQDGGTGPGGAMGTFAFVSGGQTLGNLTINRTGASGSATLGSNLTLQSALTLTAGDINTGANVLTHNGTSSGAGDVVGNVRRTDLDATARSFGNPNNQISFTAGTAPTEITVNLAKSQPTGNGFGYPNAVRRTYIITPTGGSGFVATLRLHYLDTELNGNTETLLDFWRFNGTVWQRVVKTLADPVVDNWIQSNAVTQFSPWTLAQGNALTESRLSEFKATQYDAGTVLNWKTGFEVDNLGFNLYREVGGRRTLVNSSLIAGSALVAGPKVAMTAGNSYSWTDYVGGATARYYLEEIDLNGASKTYGPFAPARVGGRPAKGVRSPVISGLTDGAQEQDAQQQWTRTEPARGLLARAPSGASATAQEKQRWLAAHPAVKIGVRTTGWYRVTRAQLTAAGLSPSADPTRLQLYAGGVEVPIRVGADGSLEFYGQGLDVQSTDTRVYWLVEGDTAGLRTDAPHAGSGSLDGDDSTQPGGVSTSGGEADGAGNSGQTGGTPVVNEVPIGPSPNGPEFFNYTVERRERTVYFSGLQNGEAENFFGKVVNATAGTQTLTVRNLLQLDAQSATLEVSLQGLTTGEHHVSVSLNGTNLGTLDFAGQTNKIAAFAVEGYMLHEGDNQVQLVSDNSGDVSLTDRLRLTYLHSMNADDDRLRFNAPAGVVRVGGFSTPAIRVIDVTDPAAPFEVPVTEDAVLDSQGLWSVRFNVAGAGDARELFAFAAAQVSPPASVVANSPSTWSTGAGQQADMVVITHGNFTQQVAPLVAQRAAEGMNVKVVDVEDLFDEFSYGAHTPQAVRDFLAWTKANWEKAPAYVLLVGDGSYDPRDYFAHGRYDLVPSKLVDAGAMETASDDWFADFDDDGIGDMAVGRLPVRTPAEASTVVGKIVSRTFDPTQTSALLVADRDGPDGYNFEASTDGVQALLPTGTNVARINRRAQDAATVRSQIVSGVNAGPLVVNWMGHGSIDVWTGDGLLRGSDAPTLQNGSRLPLFVMMTCLNGYYEGTGLDSLAESVLKAEQGGAYAVWASSGMTEPSAQAAANRELYRIIFAEGGTVRLGDAVRRAKTATADRDVRRTWVLFGDPSSRLR